MYEGAYRRFRLDKTGFVRKTYVLRQGNLPVATMRPHRPWSRGRADVAGDWWVWRRGRGLLGLLGFTATITRQSTGEPIAHKRMLSLDFVHGPTLRWRPAQWKLRGEPSRYEDPAGVVVARFGTGPRSTAVEGVSGIWHVDVTCALVGGPITIGTRSTPSPVHG